MDILLHLAAGFSICLILRLMGINAAIAMGVVIVAAFLKENADIESYNAASQSFEAVKDVGMTMLGGIFPAMIKE